MLELKSVQSVPSGGHVNIFNISAAALLSDVKCMNPVHLWVHEEELHPFYSVQIEQSKKSLC